MKSEEGPSEDGDFLDDAFEQIISGLDFGDDGNVGGEGPLEDPPASKDPEPDGESTETPVAKEKWVGLVISPIDAPAALRAALDLVGSPAPVVHLGTTTGVYLSSDSEDGEPQPDGDDDAELLALLGDERPAPKSVQEMAELVSKLSRPGAVAFVSWIRQGDGDGVDPTGTITARRYVAGEAEDLLSAGLVLAGMPLVAEELLLGRLKPEDVPDFRPGGNWLGWFQGRGPRR